MLEFPSMKRPYFTQCIAVDNGDYIWIKASMGVEEPNITMEERLGSDANPASPFQRIGLFKNQRFTIKIQGRDGNHTKIYDKDVETDRLGNMMIKIPSFHQSSRIVRLQFFESSMLDGFQLLIDSIIPFKIKHPIKIVISDFDKTLVDTRYSTPREMYHSLSKPLSYFPTVSGSLDKIREYLSEGFQPFILSASPHFYEKPIRDWLYHEKIFTSNIFLKDYRDLLSWSFGELSPKDIKKQGFYKLDALVDILEFSTLPDELVLMGDGFEADTVIYLALRSILVEQRDPWQVWNHIRKHESFKLTIKQNFTFLQRLNKLASAAKKKDRIKLTINIRCSSEDMRNLILKTPLSPDFFESQKQYVNFYIA